MAKKEIKYITEKTFRRIDEERYDLEELAYEIGRQVAKMEGNKIGHIDGWGKVEIPTIHDEWDVTINNVYVELQQDWEFKGQIDVCFPVEYLWDKNWKETRKQKEKEEKEKEKKYKKENAEAHKKLQREWEHFLKLSDRFSEKDIKKLWQYRHGLDL